MAHEEVTTKREEIKTEEQLQTLFDLQTVDSKIDKIKLLQGSLPLEVADLEDEVEGLRTRVSNLEKEIQNCIAQIETKRQEIKSAEVLIKKYTEQQKNVRNNREFDALSKELEYQRLEVELRNKHIKEFISAMEAISHKIADARTHIRERELDLETKKKELETIIADTAVEMEQLGEESAKLLEMLPERLNNAYLRIRGNARNGLAVVSITRGACGGCFNRIPPQRQLEVRLRKKIIVCEYCGRIIVHNPEEEIQENE